MMNECMDEDTFESINGLTVRNFHYVAFGQMCGGGDTSKREKWIVKDAKSYGPGIQIFYSSSDSSQIDPIIQNILSTFKFTN